MPDNRNSSGAEIRRYPSGSQEAIDRERELYGDQYFSKWPRREDMGMQEYFVSPSGVAGEVRGADKAEEDRAGREEIWKTLVGIGNPFEKEEPLNYVAQNDPDYTAENNPDVMFAQQIDKQESPRIQMDPETIASDANYPIPPEELARRRRRMSPEKVARMGAKRAGFDDASFESLGLP